MFDTIDNAVIPYKEAWAFFFSRPLQILSDFTKVVLLGLLLQIIFGGLGEGLAIAMDVDVESGNLPLHFVVASMIIAIPALILAAALNATPYSLVDERVKGRSGTVIQKTIELLLPMGRYMLTVLLIFILLLIVIFVLSGLATLVNPLLGMIPLIAGIVAVILFVYALQFSIPEIVLHGTGTKEAIKRSWSIAAKNAGTVIVFDLLLVVFIILLAILLSILTLPVASLSSMGGVVELAYMVTINVVNSIAISMLIVLSFYFLWKRLTAPEKAPVKKTKRKPMARRKARRKKR